MKRLRQNQFFTSTTRRFGLLIWPSMIHTVYRICLGIFFYFSPLFSGSVTGQGCSTHVPSSICPSLRGPSLLQVSTNPSFGSSSEKPLDFLTFITSARTLLVHSFR